MPHSKEAIKDRRKRYKQRRRQKEKDEKQAASTSSSITQQSQTQSQPQLPQRRAPQEITMHTGPTLPSYAMDFVVDAAPIDVLAKSLQFVDQRARAQSIARLREYVLTNKKGFNVELTLFPDMKRWFGEGIFVGTTAGRRLIPACTYFKLREHRITRAPKELWDGVGMFVYRPDKHTNAYMAIKKMVTVDVEFGNQRALHVRHPVDKQLLRTGIVSTAQKDALVIPLFPADTATDRLGFIRVQVYHETDVTDRPCFAYKIEALYLSESVVFGMLATGEPTAVAPSRDVASDSEEEYDPAPKSFEELAEILEILDVSSDEDDYFDSDSDDSESDDSDDASISGDDFNLVIAGSQVYVQYKKQK